MAECNYPQKNRRSRQVEVRMKIQTERMKIDLFFPFLTEREVSKFVKRLKVQLPHASNVRIVCGSFKNITSPSALSILKNELSDVASIHWDSNSHKPYRSPFCVYHEGDSITHVFIAETQQVENQLMERIEWGIDPDQNIDFVISIKLSKEFDRLFSDSVLLDDKLLDKCSKSWKKPLIMKDPKQFVHEKTEEDEITPRGAQIEALYALKNTRADGNRNE